LIHTLDSIDEINTMLAGTFREQRVFLNSIRLLANEDGQRPSRNGQGQRALNHDRPGLEPIRRALALNERKLCRHGSPSGAALPGAASAWNRASAARTSCYSRNVSRQRDPPAPDHYATLAFPLRAPPLRP
jgi:hypothetical protein